MNYKKILLDYELADLRTFYLNRISKTIFSLEKYPSLEKFNHRGSVALGQSFFSNFPILKSSLDNLFGEENYLGRFFATRPNSKGFIHIDMAQGKLEKRHWSLNIPIFDCENNYHEFFSTHLDPDLVSKEFNSWFWTTDNESTLIDQLELTHPYIINVSIPHRINNYTNCTRVVLAIRTIKNEKTFNFL